MNGDGAPRLPLAEWIALAAHLEGQQAAAGQGREARISFVGRAAVVALLLAQPSDEGSRALHSGEATADTILLEMGCESDLAELKESPERLAAALEGVRDVQYPAPSGEELSIAMEDTETRAKVLQKLGHILCTLFARGQAPPDASMETDAAPEKRRRDGSENYSDDEDEEQPGPEKGRQKRFLGEASKSLRRLQISGLEDFLTRLSLPEAVSTLLKDLVEPDNSDVDECAFLSLEDVGAELREIISQPEAFLTEESGRPGVLGGGSLVGRTAEVTCLLEAAARAEMAEPLQPNAVVLIGGRAGAGKSFLVEGVRGTLEGGGWIVAGCKFDRLMQAQPLSTLASAFEGLFQHLVTVDQGGDADNIVASVLACLGAPGIVVMSGLIPSLRRLYPSVFASIVMDDSSESSEEGGKTSPDDDDEDELRDEEIMTSASSAKNRLFYLFRRLVRAIATPEHPLFLWIDDMQWIDESSMELLSSLLTDTDHLGNEDDGSQCLLLVGSFRDNEVDGSHILSKYRQKFEDSELVNVRSLQLDAITRQDVGLFVSEALRLPTRRTRSLSDALYSKTLGNPLHLKVKLKSLVDDKILRWSLGDKRWTWDIEAMKATSVDNSVAVLMTRKMAQLPEETQNAVKVASCFGLRVEDNSVALLQSCEEFSNLDVGLVAAQQEGILERGEGIIKFPHDIVQQAAYELMSTDERGRCHFAIGLRLFSHLSLTGESIHSDPTAFVAADQINMAKSLPHSEGNKLAQPSIDFATLNRIAGERSLESCDFVAAMKYLYYGVSFLPETRWEAEYDLTLRMYDSLALASHVCGQHNKMKECLEEIMQNAKTHLDKMKGLFIIVQSLSSLGELKAAVSKVLSILEDLDEPFDLETTPAAVQDTLMATKRSLDNYSKEDLISLPRLTNKRLHWALTLMTFILPNVFVVNPRLLPLLACRMVNISTREGICGESALGFSTYGYCLITVFTDIDEAYRWGKIAIALLESTGAKDLMPKLKILCYYTVFSWKEPLQSTSAAMLQCHQEALMVGDNEYASRGAYHYCAENLVCGGSLATADRECTTLARQAIQSNQLTSCLNIISKHQSAVRLIGSETNPFDVLSYGVTNEDELLQHALSTGRVALCHNIYFHRLKDSFLLKRYDRALQNALKYEPRQFFQDAYASFYSGLTAFHFIRQPAEESKREKCIELAEKALASMKVWAPHSTWNWENKLLLLTAESLFTKGETEMAEEKYQAAIESARRHRFICEEGLANELLSAFYVANGEADKAKRHSSEARTCYEKWGALALVKLIPE
ncbi:hypothetical protein ACHAXT_010782 [Thalassiosira profunda]